jgi:hypothetical protein
MTSATALTAIPAQSERVSALSSTSRAPAGSDRPISAWFAGSSSTSSPSTSALHDGE